MIYPELDGKAVVVTGAGGGIGSACVRAFLQQGARVVAGDVAPAGLARLADEHGSSVLAIECDVTDAGSCRQIAVAAADEFGRIDAVVTAGAIHMTSHISVLDMQIEDWRRLQEVNVLGTLQVIRACVPHMTGGSITTFTSGVGRQADPRIGAYAVSKAAVWMLTRVLALDLGPRRIRVNCIGPGLIETAMTQQLLARPGERARIEALTPLGRIGRPNDIADVVVFLASDGARFITGDWISVDGGKDAAQRV